MLHFMIANNGNQPAAITSIEIDSKMSFGIGTWYLDNQLDGTLLNQGKLKYLMPQTGHRYLPLFPMKFRRF
jgi:hypothetical protein